MGKDIVEREAEKKYGSDFYNSLSEDLKMLLPGVKGFASTNLRYMVKFYKLYSSQNLPQLVGDLTEEELFSIHWGIDRCSGNICEAVFFIRKTIENNWSRTLLMNFLDTDLYERRSTLESYMSDVMLYMSKSMSLTRNDM